MSHSSCLDWKNCSPKSTNPQLLDVIPNLPYGARFNNCEQFISYITTGILKSDQAEAVENITEALARMYVVFATASLEGESKKSTNLIFEETLEKLKLNRFAHLSKTQSSVIHSQSC